ncbi:MAG: exodeoxyribonuclease VII large subunit [Clostridia bacterium]|nr:exodeoxyribonuclease VII large subunit [Clostridia bacterium]
MTSDLFITVTQLNRVTKSVLDGAAMLQNVFVCGELSNISIRSSGHMYFSLKDNESSVRCVMFDSSARRLRFALQNGMRVICRGKISIYEKDGQCQLYCADMQPDGIGSEHVAFERLKAKLSAEGLFDPQLKKPLPRYPKRICAITSDTGAAIHDIINVLSKRWPYAELILVPSLVQGPEAPASLCRALEFADTECAADVIIIGRGGGSSEDLSAFNNEALARRISSCNTPIISAVGHETDFTICDFVADLRAPTPSAAAESATPDRTELLKLIDSFNNSLLSAINSKLNYCKLQLDYLSKNIYLSDPSKFFGKYGEQLERCAERLEAVFKSCLDKKKQELFRTATSLESLSPVKVMQRGYAIVSKDGNSLNSASDLNIGDAIDVRLIDGALKCVVSERNMYNESKF